MYDTSDNYGTELVIGRAISAGVLPRDEVIVATKTGLGTTLREQQAWNSAGYRQDTSPDRIRSQVDNSLLTLGEDVGIIDLYQLHVPDERVEHEAHADVLTELIDVGKIREYGLSNYSCAELEEFLAACDKRGLRRPAAIQPYFNVLSSSTINNAAIAKQEGIILLAHSPLAKGAFTEKRLSELRSLLAEVREVEDVDEERLQYYSSLLDMTEALDGVSRVAIDRKRNLAQAAVAWVAMHEDVIVLAATTTPEYLDDAVAGARWGIAGDVELCEQIETVQALPGAEQSGNAMNGLMRHIRKY